MKIEVGKFYKYLSEENEDFNTNDIVIVRKAESGVVEVEKFGKGKGTQEVTFEVFGAHFEKIEMATLGESVNAFFDAVRKMMYGKEDEPDSEPCEYPEGTELTPNGLFTVKKPAHYDTAIDTIAFAKANFTPEQVEGFMRINAIKYLQRDKGQKLSDLKKARHYIDMLIEMEGGK